MAKHGRKSGKNQETQVIDLKAYQAAKEKAYAQTEAHIEYDEEEERAGEERERKIRIPKAVYRVAVILLVLVLGLTLWLNREALHPERIGNWVRLQFLGDRVGDGFPLPLTGTQAAEGNFAARDGNAVVLSDTAYTVVDPTGKELASVRHSLNAPVLRLAGDRALLYSQGGTGYQVLAGEETRLESAAARDITCGAIAQNGRFALALQGGDGASELEVYQADGTLQFHYVFAKDNVTALALNYDGTYGLACTVRAQGGELISKVTVFYFNETEPLAEYETRDTVFLDAAWTESGDLYAVGDSSLLRARSPDYSFLETYYDGRRLTAYRLDRDRAFLSVSAYDHAGPSTLLVYRGQGEALRVEEDQRILSIGSSGGNVCLLVGGEAVFYDASTGTELGRAPVSADARAVALGSESMGYLLGVSELRTVEIP